MSSSCFSLSHTSSPPPYTETKLTASSQVRQLGPLVGIRGGRRSSLKRITDFSRPFFDLFVLSSLFSLCVQSVENFHSGKYCCFCPFLGFGQCPCTLVHPGPENTAVVLGVCRCEDLPEQESRRGFEEAAGWEEEAGPADARAHWQQEGRLRKRYTAHKVLGE